MSAIGIAGMDRLVRATVIAKPGRAVEAAALASLPDGTPEGKSIVDKAREMLGAVPAMPEGVDAVASTAQTRLSGLDPTDRRRFRKGPRAR